MARKSKKRNSTIIQGAVHQELINKSSVHLNVGEGFIVTTEDKIHLCLIKYMTSVERKSSWIAPAGLLASIVLTILTSNFKDWLFSHYVWQAIFIITGALCLIWLIREVYKSGKAMSVEEVIDEIKKSSERKMQEDLGLIPMQPYSQLAKTDPSREIQK
jgi:hypothetical protein